MLLVPVVMAVVALALVAANDERGFVAGLAVSPVAVATDMEPGQETCQSPIEVEESFSRVRFQVGTHFRPGPELEVTIRDANSGTLLRRGRLAAGYPDISKPAVLVGDVPAGRQIGVCIKNVGDRKAALFGSGGDQLAATRLTLDARPRLGELTMSFYVAERPSALEEVPEIFRRASHFRPSWVGAWTFWALGFLLLVAVPLLLLGALRSSFGEGSLEGRRDERALLLWRHGISERRRPSGDSG